MSRPVLFLEPVLNETLWGGYRLANEYGYGIPGQKIGECRAISALPGSDCVIKNDIYLGKTLSQLWNEMPFLFGDRNEKQFPLLIKILDAKEDLSIQVHPDDSYAAEHENGSLGKTECWYILDCEENAALVIGHNAKTKQELKEMIDQARWTELIRKVPVKKGDFIQIEPGTIHSIMGGIILLEIQQSSDITYRVYDYDRLLDGKPRKLHIQQSLDVITVPAPSVEDNLKTALSIPENKMFELISCQYYKVWKLNLSGTFSFEQSYPFLMMNVTEGKGLLNGRQIQKGDHLILPAGFGRVDMQGDAEMILSTVNN